MILSLGSAARTSVADAKASTKEANRMVVALFIFLSLSHEPLPAAGNSP